MSYLSYVLPLGAVALALPYLRQRLQLSRAKHRSLAGHSRMAKRLASWLPGYALDESHFFDCDGAPADIAQLRRASFDTLAAGYAQRYANSLALSAKAREGLADLQFTGRYRVPFQFSSFVQERLKVGAFVASAEGSSVIDLDGNRFIDLTGSYGVNVFGVDFYKACMAEGARIGETLGPVLGAYHPCVAENTVRLKA
ncbi:MAG: glutamate-1-semialdehyde 2,1-aminomutase, partial [Rubrivivax sp.]